MKSTEDFKNAILAEREKKLALLKRTKTKLMLVIEAKSKPCTDCGECYPPYVMDMDHRNPKTKIACIGTTGTAFSFEALVDELAKCDPVCANCHRERSWGEGREGSSFRVFRGGQKVVKSKVRKATDAHHLANKQLVWDAKYKPCVDCGIEYPPYVSNLVRKDRTQKKFGMGGIWQRLGPDRIREELVKCEVLCENCNRIRHWAPK